MRAETFIPLRPRLNGLPFNELSVSFSKDGLVVTVSSNFDEIGGNFSVVTGAVVDLRDGAEPAMAQDEEGPPIQKPVTDGSLGATLRAALIRKVSDQEAKRIVTEVVYQNGKLVARLVPLSEGERNTRAPPPPRPAVLELEGAINIYSTKGFGIADGLNVLLVLSSGGLVTAHSLEDGKRVALIVPTSPSSAVVFFPDGSVELRGNAPIDALRCRTRERLEPFDTCRAAREAKRMLVFVLGGYDINSKNTKGKPGG